MGKNKKKHKNEIETEDLFEPLPQLSAPAPKPAPVKARTYIPELDGWRVLLVFWVSWYHIWQQSWLTPYVGKLSLDYLIRAGYMPVDGTILLSGFLLFLPYAEHMRHHTPLPSAKEFYQRRVKRIVPSFWAFTFLMLFVVAIPFGEYKSIAEMVWDLLSHLTFTFTFSRQTYLGSHLGAPGWTLCVEMHMYLLFPWIARMACKRTGATLLGMCAIAAFFRMWALWYFKDYQMVVNQMISFLDVYAIGMACALLYIRIRDVWDDLEPRWLYELCFTAILVICAYFTTLLVRGQATSAGQDGIQAGQMIRRLPYALTLGGIMLTLPFAIKPLRLLLGNPVMRFLSGISMNYYLIHQPIAIYLKRIHFPPSAYDLPNQARDVPRQYQYTFLCFLLSLLLATLLTYLIEKPCSKLLTKLFNRR